jgi:hypothetical protein
MKSEVFDNKIATEPMFLMNSAEEAAIRTVPTGNGLDVFVKFQGKKEFKAQKGSKVVADAYLEQNIITEKEYNDF